MVNFDILSKPFSKSFIDDQQKSAQARHLASKGKVKSLLIIIPALYIPVLVMLCIATTSFKETAELTQALTGALIFHLMGLTMMMSFKFDFGLFIMGVLTAGAAVFAPLTDNTATYIGLKIGMLVPLTLLAYQIYKEFNLLSSHKAFHRALSNASSESCLEIQHWLDNEDIVAYRNALQGTDRTCFTIGEVEAMRTFYQQAEEQAAKDRKQAEIDAACAKVYTGNLTGA
ncbi:hypothetical protein [Neptuniibacter sp. QD37_11]|uniref:hypothetical protein n=1 Tax=Neptuniibacter sp. QD37_11 TaxID=3398209 RepID=UPI0039F4B16A